MQDLPAEVRELLRAVQLTISLGIDGIPLACIGANGYIPRLAFWVVLPAILVAVTSCIGATHTLFAKRCRVTSTALLEATMPTVLRIFFLAYPIVTNVAFEGMFHTFKPTQPCTTHSTHSNMVSARYDSVRLLRV